MHCTAIERQEREAKRSQTHTSMPFMLLAVLCVHKTNPLLCVCVRQCAGAKKKEISENCKFFIAKISEIRKFVGI